ncbi:A disintegrin and metalloproteinase with thrombospondin motifs 1-like [Diadema antillarum]|uniref:A disintegrin and metalloproteinase with thrombospondin motifs 1-like n=1 Tax=Diadema antillarum TaxID=105358 RepID=UPI003A879EE7
MACPLTKKASLQETSRRRLSDHSATSEILVATRSPSGLQGKYDIILPRFVRPSSRISKRGLDATKHPISQEVKFTAFGEDHHLKLKLNNWLLKPDLEVEYVLANGTIRKQPLATKNCHYFSTSVTHQQAKGALSTCDGMRGSISVGNEVLHIEPLKDDHARRVRRSDSLASHPHVIYKRDASSEEPAKCPVVQRDVDGNSGGGGDTACESETTYDGPYLGRKYIEIFYVADSLVYQEFGDDTESYAMTILNIAPCRDESTVSFTVTPDADSTLDDFCEWQAQLSYNDDDNQDDWDLAILFSGEDLHSSNQYNLLGLSYVGAVCSLNSKCQITENCGLSAGFVMSHESGHRQVWFCHCTYFWFSDRETNHARFAQTTHQTTDCGELWCMLPNSPLLSEFYGTTAEGTSCGEEMWCIGGVCVSSKLDVAPAVDGGWTEYSNFSECSRTCGTGVRVRIRNCTNPTPQWGGEPCVGDSHDYELCNQEGVVT